MTVHTLANDVHDAMIQAELEALRAENNRLKAASASRLRFKVSEKKAVSVLGLQQFPVTLYAGQWERLIEAMPALKAFIEQNNSQLSRK